MKKGIDMLVDGHDADVVRAVMEKDIELTSERHATAIKVFRSLGISARHGHDRYPGGVGGHAGQHERPQIHRSGHGGGLADDPCMAPSRPT